MPFYPSKCCELGSASRLLLLPLSFTWTHIWVLQGVGSASIWDSNSKHGSSLGSVRVHSLTLFALLGACEVTIGCPSWPATFQPPCFGREPKVRVATFINKTRSACSFLVTIISKTGSCCTFLQNTKLHKWIKQKQTHIMHNFYPTSYSQSHFIFEVKRC
jgi:hypothetical protein